MGLWSWLKGRNSGTAGGRKARRIDLPPWLHIAGGGQGPLVGAWSDSRIEQVRHFRHWVYVAVSAICEKVAHQLPNVSRIVPDSVSALGDPLPPGPASPRWLGGFQIPKQRALTPLQEHERLSPVEPGHPLLALLRDANVLDTSYDLWYETVMFLLLTGSAYWWVPKNKLGYPAEIWAIPSHWVWPIPGKTRVIEGYQLRPVEGMYRGAVLPAEDVIHFRRKSPVSKLDGFSPMTAGAQWIDGMESINDSRYHSFRNGIFPQLKIEFGDDMEVDDEQIDRIEAKILSRYGRENNAGKPFVCPPGAKANPLVMTPREMDWGQSFEQIRDSILALYRVPLVVVGISKEMTYGSLLAAQASFCTFGVNPLLSYLSQTITERLCPYWGPEYRVWWYDTTPIDPQIQEMELKTDITARSITVNELRALRGRPPIEGGDVLVDPSPATGQRGGDHDSSTGRGPKDKQALLRWIDEVYGAD